MSLKILDVGCGPGIYVTALREAGLQADGVDLDPRCPYDKKDIFSEEFLELYQDKYDMAISLEVGEHLPEDKADEFVKRLTLVAPVILFLAAFPGQGGYGHINCQPKSYWIEKFARLNYVVDEISTDNIVEYMRSGYHLGWFAINAIVFKRYGEMYYDKIIEEETPQAVRLAEYIKNNFIKS
jgi:SAM-dependent methyltransferase